MPRQRNRHQQHERSRQSREHQQRDSESAAIKHREEKEDREDVRPGRQGGGCRIYMILMVTTATMVCSWFLIVLVVVAPSTSSSAPEKSPRHVPFVWKPRTRSSWGPRADFVREGGQGGGVEGGKTIVKDFAAGGISQKELSDLRSIVSASLSKGNDEKSRLDLNRSGGDGAGGRRIVSVGDGKNEGIDNAPAVVSALKGGSLSRPIESRVSDDRPRVLLVWPTIPVSYKGSDSRAIDAVRYLSSPDALNFVVDLLFWRDYATEARPKKQWEFTYNLNRAWYDDSPDRERLQRAGVRRILGPYDKTKLSESHTYVGSYYAVVYWLWTDVKFLDTLMDVVDHIRGLNGRTKMIAAVDDAGVASRFLVGQCCKKGTKPVEEVERFVLDRRPKHLLGAEAVERNVHGGEGNEDENQREMEKEFDEEKLYFGTTLLYQETYLYAIADALVGVNAATTRMLEKMVPGVPVYQLSYVSPVQPPLVALGTMSNVGDSNTMSTTRRGQKLFKERRGYVFFGYNNFANNEGLSWFIRDVLPMVEPSEPLHVAGAVQIPEMCVCNDGFLPGTKCTSTDPQRVICHGPIPNDEALADLIGSVKVAINPVLEPSGVATKTCRAMALGTPVVVTDQDGTFQVEGLDKVFGGALNSHSVGVPSMISGGKRCILRKNGNKSEGEHEGAASSPLASCFASALNALLKNEVEWMEASRLAPSFIAQNYGAGRYAKDWAAIINGLAKKQVEVVLEGDAVRDYVGSREVWHNWHIVNALSSEDTMRVTVIGNSLDPPIPGVRRIDPFPATASLPSSRLETDEKGVGRPSSPFATGFQANLVIRRSMRGDGEGYVPTCYCGVSCRVVEIVSPLAAAEYGSLPVSWATRISDRSDVLWAPSERYMRSSEKAGFPSVDNRKAVIRQGVECDLLISNDEGDDDDEEEEEGNQFVGEENGNGNNNIVTFLFSGGLMPKTGIDILLEEWESLFCGNAAMTEFTQDGDGNVKLILHTTNDEYGFSSRQLRSIERIVERCVENGNRIVWLKKRDLDNVEEYIELLNKADVFVAPYRTDDGASLGLTLAEAFLSGLSVVATSIGFEEVQLPVAGREPLEGHGRRLDERHRARRRGRRFPAFAYPVQSYEEACRREPCWGRQLCVFPPCHSGACSCETLVDAPTWFEIDRHDLRLQLKHAYKDIQRSIKVLNNDPEEGKRDRLDAAAHMIRKEQAPEHQESLSERWNEDNKEKNYNHPPCWEDLFLQYQALVFTTISGRKYRTTPPFIYPIPPLTLRLTRIARFFIESAKFVVHIGCWILVIFIIFYIAFPNATRCLIARAGAFWRRMIGRLHLNKRRKTN